MRPALAILLVVAAASPLMRSPVAAGPYPGAAGTPGSDAVALDDPEINAWAAGVAELVRGPANITDLSKGHASFGVAANALGPVLSDDPENVYDTVSLGDGGSITLTFEQPIRDGEGWDFAVFENGFSLSGLPTGFLELAFVEVSSNGVDFVRFPSVSLTQTTTQVAGFAWIDPTDLHNLAGKHIQGWGTPFDLAALAGAGPWLDVNAITHVRIIDVVGILGSPFTRHDSLGNPINEPWSTPFATGGFDLDAVGVRHVAFAPASGYAAWKHARFTAAQLAVPAFVADAADPDGDGRANLLEYALGTSPTLADSGVNAPTVAIVDGRLSLACPRPVGRDDLAYVVEWSPGLAADPAAWYSGTDYVSISAPEPSADGGDPVVVARAVAPLGAPASQFLRLRVGLVAP